MKLLVDTHLLLWTAGQLPQLSQEAKELLGDIGNDPIFSVASLWELAIKSALGRPNFRVDINRLRLRLLDNGWQELTVIAAHAVAVAKLPLIHKDPFDRMLLAQAESEGLTLLTADARLARYPGPVRLV